jgi:ubiquinol-cytochrome c reductase cytochrome b subunit
MASWIYIFGVLSLASLVVVIASGTVLSLKGPGWWHFTGVGLFFNSIHLWAVELFFFFMVIHLWCTFFMAAWRGRRGLTWVLGAVAFLASVGTAFTGYLVQSNFDSQWIATQAKDGLNSVGVGAWFNVLDVGQMLLFHVLLLPAALAALIAGHLLLVRRRGVVPPFPIGDAGTEPAVAAAAGREHRPGAS